MPDDDMTHPVVDLSGYITEGQIVLDRGLHERSIFPPIDVLPSLSRLMGKGIGKGKTDPIHGVMADSLYAAYARSRELRRLKMIVGEEGLSALEKEYLSFGDRFEGKFINQGETYRSLEESINVAWQCLETLPSTELYRLPTEATQRRGGKAVE
jgi:V/A-type H+-transporting ATPase subunit B